MKKRLILLDLVLAVLTAVVGFQVRERWMKARKREAVILHAAVKSPPAPPYSPLPDFEPLAAANYGDIAMKTLFSPDRNPTVVIEVAPPKPMPPLPVMHGVMDLGDGPTVIMSLRSGATHKGYRMGDQIGEFKLVSIGREEIVFEWEGKTITKRIEELIDRSTAAPQAAEGASAAPAPAPVKAAAAPSADSKSSGPGADVGGNTRACQPDDPSPNGTIKDGYRKVMANTPFGKMCRWEPVSQ